MRKSDIRFQITVLAGICYLSSGVTQAAVPDGYVVKVDSSVIYLDWGKSAGVSVGDQFTVYRPGEPLKHPVTGEILGQSEINLGQGVLENIEEKFSSGKLIETKGEIKAGDRTRYAAPAPVPAPSSTGTPAALTAPKEFYRTEPINHEAVGLAIGDVVGDGKKEVVVAYRDQVEAFKWDGQKLTSLAIFKSRSYSNFLAVETGDLEGAGHDKIFASLFIEGIKRAETIVLEYKDGVLKDVGHIDGMVRAFDRNGKRELVYQDMSMAREMKVRQPAPVVLKGKKYDTGAPIKLARALNDDQFFGYQWGDWDGDGAEDFAFLQGGERLRIFFGAAVGTKGGKWSNSEIYGGTKSDFDWSDDQIGSVFPRLMNLKTASPKIQLLVPHNLPATGIRLARLKIYHEAELLDLGWNGLDMAQVWRIPVTGELADYGVGDVTGVGSPQVWTAVVSSGDKTVLLGYTLP